MAQGERVPGLAEEVEEVEVVVAGGEVFLGVFLVGKGEGREEDRGATALEQEEAREQEGVVEEQLDVESEVEEEEEEEAQAAVAAAEEEDDEKEEEEEESQEEEDEEEEDEEEESQEEEEEESAGCV